MVPPILRELTRLDSVGQVDRIAPLPRWLTPTPDDPDSAPKQPLTDPAANGSSPPPHRRCTTHPTLQASANNACIGVRQYA